MVICVAGPVLCGTIPRVAPAPGSNHHDDGCDAGSSAPGRSGDRPPGSRLQPAEYAVREAQQVIAAKTQMNLPVRGLPLTAVRDGLHGHQYAP